MQQRKKDEEVEGDDEDAGNRKIRTMKRMRLAGWAGLGWAELSWAGL